MCTVYIIYVLIGVFDTCVMEHMFNTFNCKSNLHLIYRYIEDTYIKCIIRTC